MRKRRENGHGSKERGNERERKGRMAKVAGREGMR